MSAAGGPHDSPSEEVITRTRVVHTHSETREVSTPATVHCANKNTLVAPEKCAGCARQLASMPGVMVCEVPMPETQWVRSREDTLRLTAILGGTPVRDAMSTEVHAVTPELPLYRAAQLMLDHHISSVTVVDQSRKPIGVLSKTDLLRDAHEGPIDPPSDDVRRVEEVMTQNAFAVPETEELGKAAALMVAERLHHLPVIAADGKLCGVLSALDFPRWLAHRAGYLVPPAGPR